MQWNSVGEFMAMGGYGLYVWPSFAMTALCMVWEVVALLLRHTEARTASLERSVRAGGRP